VKIMVRRVAPTPQRPHGLAYSFTLHDAEGRRLVGFDNAHQARGRRARPAAHDHWHRGAGDEGRPYVFRSAFDLVQDFLNEVERVLRERGVSMAGIDVEGRRRT
jgi:hypothetical protein